MELELNKDTIYGLVHTLLKSGFDNPLPIPKFHLELWDLACQPTNRVAIAAPRGHAKSTAITHSFVLACVLFRQRKYVLIVSDTEGQAILFLSDIKRELLNNEKLIALFGIKKFVKESETDIIIEFDDGEQFRIVAKGSEQKVRGLKWRGKRPDLIVGDDLENDEIVLNEERRAKFRQWFFNALLPAGSDDCWVRIVGTILHMDALLERLMPPWGDKSVVTDGIRHWSTEKRTWTAVRYKAHNEDFSKVLWEEKFSKERLQALRKEYIEQGFPEGYSQEYLNYPIDEENAYYHKEDFNELAPGSEELPGEYYVGADLAISEKDGRAYTVFVVAKKLYTGKLQVVDVIRFRGDALQIIETVFELQEYYNPEWFAIEQENIAKAIGPSLEEQMMRRGVYPYILKINPTQDKIKRGRSMQARARIGSLEFDTEAGWFPEFQTELIQFPRGKYKDQADAFHMIGLGLDQMSDVPDPQEMADIEYEEEFGEDIFELSVANSITGYGD